MGEAQLVIRQSRPITVDEFMDFPIDRGLELIDGWLTPKTGQLSNEEATIDKRLCLAIEAKLTSLIGTQFDNLHLNQPQVNDTGFCVLLANTSFYDMTEKLEEWFESYREIWVFHPWYQSVEIHSTPILSKNYRGSDILPEFELPVADIFED